MKLKIKDQIPDIEIFHLVDGEPQTSKIRDILGNGKVVLFGLPGAFTQLVQNSIFLAMLLMLIKLKLKELIIYFVYL